MGNWFATLKTLSSSKAGFLRVFSQRSEEGPPAPLSGKTFLRNELLMVAEKGVETSTERQRVQVEFSPEAFARLLEIKTMAGAQSYAEVIRDAIRLYDWFLRQKRDDYKFQLV